MGASALTQATNRSLIFLLQTEAFWKFIVNIFPKVHSIRKITPDIKWLSDFWSPLLSKVRLSGPAAFFRLKPFPEQRTPPWRNPEPSSHPSSTTPARCRDRAKTQRQHNPQNLGDPELASKQMEQSCRAPRRLFTCECWPSEGIPN